MRRRKAPPAVFQLTLRSGSAPDSYDHVNAQKAVGRLGGLQEALAPFGTRAYKRQLERAYIDWLHTRGEFTHFITLTFSLIDAVGLRTTQQHIEQALRHLLRRLACSIHGKRQSKYRPPLRSMLTIDWGRSGNHPHAHLALESPKGMSYGQFSDLIKTSASKVRLLSGAPHIRHYEDAGGAKYLVKHGIDRMVVPLFDTH